MKVMKRIVAGVMLVAVAVVFSGCETIEGAKRDSRQGKDSYKDAKDIGK
jgi:predicted small secreted protein